MATIAVLGVAGVVEDRDDGAVQRRRESIWLVCVAVPRQRTGDHAGNATYWAIMLFCSTCTRLSVQKVQFGP
jgi:hypothetical protein